MPELHRWALPRLYGVWSHFVPEVESKANVTCISLSFLFLLLLFYFCFSLNSPVRQFRYLIAVSTWKCRLGPNQEALIPDRVAPVQMTAPPDN